jgi:hypothetical protein
MRRPHKYGAIPTVVDGIRFDSKREAQRWQELQLLERSGEIADLNRQPVFSLHVMSNACLRRTHIGDYRADFQYRDVATGAVVTEDVKGMAGLPLYRWKVKHVKAEYGVDVVEVR